MPPPNSAYIQQSLDLSRLGAAKPGTTVFVKGENVVPEAAARLWLEDRSTGQVFGEKQPVRLANMSDPTLVLSASSTDVIAIRALNGNPKHH